MCSTNPSRDRNWEAEGAARLGGRQVRGSLLEEKQEKGKGQGK